MKKKMLKKLSLLLVVAVVTCFTCATAFADSSSVTIYLDGSSIGTYTTTQLASFTFYDDVQYSSNTCKLGFVTRYASGYSLQEVLNDALSGQSMTTNDIDTIEFVATDSYTSGAVSLSNVLTGKILPSGDSVPAIIATEYGTTVGGQSGTDCIRDVFGQQATSDKVIEDWVKNLNRINLTSN